LASGALSTTGCSSPRLKSLALRSFVDLHVEISLQNADLGQVKRRLAAEARDCDATAIMNFRYGQKKHQWWELVFTFKWDTESWHGNGDAVKS
jgi:hypothetical protein